MPRCPQGHWCLKRDSGSSQVSGGFLVNPYGLLCFLTSQHFGQAKQLSLCPQAGCLPPENPHTACCLAEPHQTSTHNHSPRTPHHFPVPCGCCPGRRQLAVQDVGCAHRFLGPNRCECHISRFEDGRGECSGPCSRCRLCTASSCCLGYTP